VIEFPIQRFGGLPPVVIESDPKLGVNVTANRAVSEEPLQNALTQYVVATDRLVWYEETQTPLVGIVGVVVVKAVPPEEVVYQR
jgi:hypothetical protein